MHIGMHYLTHYHEHFISLFYVFKGKSNIQNTQKLYMKIKENYVLSMFGFLA